MHETRQNNALIIFMIVIYPVTFRAKYWRTKSARIEFIIVFPYFHISIFLYFCISVFLYFCISVNYIIRKDRKDISMPTPRPPGVRCANVNEEQFVLAHNSLPKLVVYS